MTFWQWLIGITVKSIQKLQIHTITLLFAGKRVCLFVESNIAIRGPLRVHLVSHTKSNCHMILQETNTNILFCAQKTFWSFPKETYVVSRIKGFWKEAGTIITSFVKYLLRFIEYSRTSFSTSLQKWACLTMNFASDSFNGKILCFI